MENSEIDRDVTFNLVGLCKVSALVEERLLGKGGHEEIDESIEDLIWNCKIKGDIKLNKLIRGKSVTKIISEIKYCCRGSSSRTGRNGVFDMPW